MTQLTDGYSRLLTELKQRIRSARLRTVLSVNGELILLYWSIGRDIRARKRSEGWGAKVIMRLAADLRRAFPDMTGISARNLEYMQSFADAWPDPDFLQQLAAKLPWGHNTLLLQAAKSAHEREWYARQAIENGWSRNVLRHQIESNLFARQGQALTNFTRTLPAAQSELAQQLIKDPYSFEFLALSADIRERDLQRGLLDHLRSFLLELGKGFAFIGSQYPVEVGDQEYFIDLLFYHLRLRCFVVIELKVEGFKPEFAGKMNFYLSAVDDRLRRPDDHTPRLASFSAAAAMKLSWSTRCVIPANRWESLSINCLRHCPNTCIAPYLSWSRSLSRRPPSSSWTKWSTHCETSQPHTIFPRNDRSH